MSVDGCYFAGERKRREQDTMRERGGEGKGREGGTPMHHRGGCAQVWDAVMCVRMSTP
jgi:hypothetical protein